ncbi:PucR family transcriptional regulator [Nocardia jiangsuensis]|uniref:PucR family transcriptional regulator n=1 Tax=Nocardia jiangsuensis TaxID=1691563 RepID=A0ABV8E050_9NOCA
MIENAPATADLLVSGRPASAHLRDVRTLARRLVGHFADNVVPCGTLPGDALSGEITVVTRICLELALDLLDGRETTDKTERVQEAAADWAREGIPIDAIHNAVHEGLRIGFDLIVAKAGAQDSPAMVDLARKFMEIQDRITRAVSTAYVRELKSVVSEHHTAVHTLTSALLGGRSTSTMARESAVAIADSYHVLALAVPPHRDEHNIALDAQVVARRKLRRLQAALADHCGGDALALLSVDGGTVLLPTDRYTEQALDTLIDRLALAAQVPLVATTVRAGREEIPLATDQAHELLDVVQRLGWPHRLHRFDDLVLEYQLARPGPARTVLAAALEPLDEQPDLLQTLRTYIAKDLNRQRTARALHVHANTVDHRFRRIGQLTGFDPGQAHGLWYLRSALIARAFEAGAAAPVRRAGDSAAG